MDYLSIAGFFIAVLAIIGGQYLEGGALSALINGPAFVIVLGGTLGAVLLETPYQVFKRAMIMMYWVLLPSKKDLKQEAKDLVRWATVARKEGLLALDPILDREHDPFTQKALQLLLDGSEPDTIRNVLEQELETKEINDLQAAQVYENMGGYAPTLGIIGAVIGLIHVMGSLDDPQHLGAGIAIAFVATVYGVGFANLFFIPVANKLKTTIQEQALYRAMMIEGISAISDGENPRTLRLKLSSFI